MYTAGWPTCGTRIGVGFIGVSVWLLRVLVHIKCPEAQDREGFRASPRQQSDYPQWPLFGNERAPPGVPMRRPLRSMFLVSELDRDRTGGERRDVASYEREERDRERFDSRLGCEGVPRDTIE